MSHKQAKAIREAPALTLVLSDRDREAFFDVLINPPEPSERLKQAMVEHERRIAP